VCNLACAHCYSQSGPDARGALDARTLIAALETLRGEGYAAVSLSGGEPLVYREVGVVVRAAKALGFRVAMISNGLLAGSRRAAVIAELDGIAISFDGLAGTHDAIRGRAGAFAGACDALRRLAGDGVSVAAAISLTPSALPELPDLAYHLAERGARALQIRPVARAGRARSMAPRNFGGAADRARLFLVASALAQELGPDVLVHCDLAPSQGLWRQRDAYAALLAGDAGERPLADLANPLVITDEGRLKPIAYDFDARFDIAALETLTPAGLGEYKAGGLAALRALIADALARLEHEHDLVDWFDRCARMSERGSPRAAEARRRRHARASSAKVTR
jgi:organic radical activating enzyme